VHSRASSSCPPVVQVREEQARPAEEAKVQTAAPCNASGGRVQEASSAALGW
jgi:hypothetical protein